MNFLSNRRFFLKSSAALSAMTSFPVLASSGVSANSSSGVSLYFINDAVIMRQLAYPFPSQKLLSHGESLIPGVVYAPDDFFCPLDNLNQGHSSYFLIASLQNETFCYRIFDVDHSNFDEPRRNLVVELGPMEADQNGRAILNAHTHLYLVTRIDEKVHIFLFDSQAFQMRIVAVEDDGCFTTLSSCALKMPDQYSFHMMPKEAFSGEENVFLLVSASQKSQEFLQLDVKGAFSPEWKTLARLDHGSMLHGDWIYKFSSVVNQPQEMRGDQYFMMVQYDRNSPPAFLFLRADSRLAALTFQKNEGGFAPVVLGVSQKKYSEKETSFYAAYFDHTLRKDVVLCHDNETEKPFLLSLEKSNGDDYEFVEFPLDLNVNDEKVQGYFSALFSARSAAVNSFLVSSQHCEMGVPLQLVIINDDEENKEEYQFCIMKHGSSYVTRLAPPNSLVLKSDFKDTVVDSTVSFFVGAHNWSKEKYYLPYAVLGFIVFAGLFYLKFKTKKDLRPITSAPGVVATVTSEAVNAQVELCLNMCLAEVDQIQSQLDYFGNSEEAAIQFVADAFTERMGDNSFTPMSQRSSQSLDLSYQFARKIFEIIRDKQAVKLYNPTADERDQPGFVAGQIGMINYSYPVLSIGLFQIVDAHQSKEMNSERGKNSIWTEFIEDISSDVVALTVKSGIPIEVAILAVVCTGHATNAVKVINDVMSSIKSRDAFAAPSALGNAVRFGYQHDDFQKKLCVAVKNKILPRDHLRALFGKYVEEKHLIVLDNKVLEFLKFSLK